jgi:hypothetical protein
MLYVSTITDSPIEVHIAEMHQRSAEVCPAVNAITTCLDSTWTDLAHFSVPLGSMQPVLSLTHSSNIGSNCLN